MPRVLPYHRIGDRLLAGPMPFHDDHVAALHAEGVTAVINLCEQREYWRGERESLEAAYHRHGLAEHLLPVRDGSSVPPDVLDRAVEIARDHVSYVHCRGGRERSATVASAVLARLDGLSVDDAVKLARQRRPVFAPLEWQISGLREWASTPQHLPSSECVKLPRR
jgi:atypical dual specificity phosphatase